MLFYEGLFLVFLCVLIVLSLALRGCVRGRVWLFLIASYVFYGAWNWAFLFLIFGSTLIDFLVAARMPSATEAKRRLLLVISLLVNLGSLAVFKYLDFGIRSLNELFGFDVPLAELTLPVGISFFTFQSMSYTIDVYRGQLAPEPSFARFALFVSFFPQLVAGPIIRAADFLPQIDSALRRPLQRVGEAAPLFVLGLFKKVVVADHLSLIVDRVFSNPEAFGASDRWLATLAFAGQIYCDFSGYTDMALALCVLFGFRFPLNFRSPYLANGPQDFWRRWHISLSTWLRDYLYIPLGGSRRGEARTYLALALTMLLGGLWHGAAWTFVLWGAFHGALLVVERLLFGARAQRSLSNWIRRPVFFVLTLLGWMIFRAESWSSLRELASELWRLTIPELTAWPIVAAATVFVAVEHVVGEHVRERGTEPRSVVPRVACAGLLLPLCFLLRPAVASTFIYFQF